MSCPADDEGPSVPEGYRILHEGDPLPPFYMAEILRPHVGKTVWVADAGGRVRNGILLQVPWLREDQTEDIPPVLFEDERPLYLRRIVCAAVYDPDAAAQPPAGQGR